MITPSLQALVLAERMLSLNRFGHGEVLTSYLKTMALSVACAPKATNRYSLDDFIHAS